MRMLKRLAFFLLLLAGGFGGASGQTLTNLHSFSYTDGGNSQAGLVQGSDGNFYGTTSEGGASGRGVVFRISPSGSFSNLYSFGGGSDGANPHAALAQGSDSNFYGTTYNGGAGDNGVVFRITPGGILTNLHLFAGGSDGAWPNGRLVLGSDGSFYGTTVGGGASGRGTVFRISPSGSLANLHSFNSTDGHYPYAGLVQGIDGNFYGTTEGGGRIDLNDGFGCGVVFRISLGGSFTNLYLFTGGSDGLYPQALVQGIDGNFCGTTVIGGDGGNGIVFRISPSGEFTNLYSFTWRNDGGNGNAALTQGSDGNLYGTTYYGGGSTNCFDGCGTVFRITPSGDFTSLYSFNGSDGARPYAGLVQGSNGNFYGTTSGGGVSGRGTVFKLSVPLTPPANQISAIQLADTNVIVSIPSVASETYQLQFSDSLTAGSWSNVDGASVTNSIGALMTLTNFGGALQPQRFYRFSITP